jgi:hypothetical protein
MDLRAIYGEDMRGGVVGRRVPRTMLAGVAVATSVAFAACGAPAEPIAVPTFPSVAAGQAPAGQGEDGTAIPPACERILSPADMDALFGLPLGSVGVRTTIGVPQPGAGRTERVTCAYTRTGGRGPGRPTLNLNATAYVDAASAEKQWRVNVDVEDGEPRDVPLGSASAVLFERRGEAVLMVAHETSNLTLVLPDQPLPGGRSRGDVLVDLALRVLPAVSVVPSTAPAGSATATTSNAGA